MSFSKPGLTVALVQDGDNIKFYSSYILRLRRVAMRASCNQYTSNERLAHFDSGMYYLMVNPVEKVTKGRRSYSTRLDRMIIF